ncbi:hypothetical protein QUA41_29735 [Microcoleus sp. Pol11C1]|uniref:hypothetical protein n=1 Tax=Microcoleus sp. POL1_C1 TaxID=2818870 RepID=UPI002FCF8EFE
MAGDASGRVYVLRLERIEPLTSISYTIVGKAQFAEFQQQTYRCPALCLNLALPV